MKNIKNGILASIFTLSAAVIADEAIFDSAKQYLELDSKYIKIEYNTNIVEDFCPKQSVGCYTSADRGRIIVRDDLSKTHHDVVIFGLYSDYIQHSNTGLIDSSLTCDLKVNYLKGEMQNNLANLYSGQCDAIYRNKVLVMN